MTADGRRFLAPIIELTGGKRDSSMPDNMRQAQYRHFPLDQDTSDNPIFYEVTVPYLALVVAEDPAVPGNPPLPSRIVGYDSNGIPKHQSLREFCKEQNIRFKVGNWNPDKRKFDFMGTIRLLVFETVEDQRTVASAFPGRLR